MPRRPPRGVQRFPTCQRAMRHCKRRHHGQAEQTHAARRAVLDAAYAAAPERFVRRAPTPPPVPVAAWINKPDTKEAAH